MPCNGSAPPSHLNKGKWGAGLDVGNKDLLQESQKKTQLTKTGGHCHFQAGRKAVHGKDRAQSSDDMMLGNARLE